MRYKEELIDLCAQLRGEKLIVSSEQEQLHKLDTDVAQKLDELLQVTWISFHQQLCISTLVHSATLSTPRNTCKQIRLLEQSAFVDSCKRLGRFDSFFCQLINALSSDSRTVAQLLNALDSRHGESSAVSTEDRKVDLCSVVFADLYACCIFEADEKLVAEILLELMRLQLVPNPNPRLLLRRGNCSFSRLYKLFNEGMFAAKVFLTCALHEPIMDVLSMDDVYLDIDPSKLLIRFTPEERAEKFGREDSPQYKENVSKYRKTIVSKLHMLAQKFIQNIKASLHCFPSVISLLVRRLNDMLVCRRQQQDKQEESARTEAALISVDLIFTNFICPAIAKPESLAIITDTPVGAVARFNLMQIGQILQSLAVCQQERLDPKFDDLFSLFDADCVMGGIVGAILAAPDGIRDPLNFDSLYGRSETGGGDSETTEQRPNAIGRQIVLMTAQDLEYLVVALRRFLALANKENATDSWDEIQDLLGKIPEYFFDDDVDIMSNEKSPATLFQSKRTLRFPHARLSRPNRSSSSDRAFSPTHETFNGSAHKNGRKYPAEVLKLRLSDIDSSLPLEILSEDQFLNTLRASSIKTQNAPTSNEKKTRFDLESLGMASSDQLEASTDGESVSSSLDGIGAQDHALNDNFSDVDALPISANVSGPGSPNISGRDTPLSQHTEQHEDVAQDGEEGWAMEEPEDGVPSSHSDERSAETQHERQLPALPNTARKENRADIEEKFGKFEIPQPTRRERHRDETHSLVSDSWSTDVLASDSEFAFDQSQGVAHHGCGGGALPDLVPGGPEFARLDLIAEENVGAGAMTSANAALPPSTTDGSAAAVAAAAASNIRPIPLVLPTVHFETPSSSVQLDRSDTWSVNATTSDSDADALRADDRLKEFDDAPIVGFGGGSSSPCSASALAAQSSAKKDDSLNRHDDTSTEVRRDSSSGFSPIRKSRPELDRQPIFLQGRPTVAPPIPSTTRALDARCSEPLVSAAPPLFPSLITVQSSSSMTSVLAGGCGSVNWSEVATLGSFSQQSVTFSDDSSEPATSVPPTGPSVDQSGSSEDLASANVEYETQKAGQQGERTDGQELDEQASWIERESESAPISGLSSPYKDDSSPYKPDPQAMEFNSPRRRKIDFEEISHRPPFGGAIPKRSGFDNLSSSNRTSSNGHHNFAYPEQYFDKEDKKRSFLRTFKLSNLKSKVRRSVTENYLASATSAAFSGSRLGQSPTTGGVIDSANKSSLAVAKMTPNSLHNSSSVDSFVTATTVSQMNCRDFGVNEAVGLEVETGDQILAKYRSRRTAEVVNNEGLNGNRAFSCSNVAPIDMDSPRYADNLDGNVQSTDDTSKERMDDSKPYYDPQNVMKCRAFADVKRKLRMVLSSINVGTMSAGLSILPPYNLSNLKNSKENELVQFLNVLLAEALNTSEKFLSSQLREVLRCLALFDAKGIRKLVRSLHEEHRHRCSYVTYLQQCRLNYLQVQSYFEKLITRIRREQKLNRDWLIEFCVRLYVDQACESQLKMFVDQFKSIQLQDERTDFVENFLAKLHSSTINDQIWLGASEDQLTYAHLSVERYVMELIYTHAFYPNGEADVFRDEVFFEAIKRLSAILTPSHKDLRIPQEYQAECPWPLAQAEISIINAYKTPRDRLGCVLRCCETIVDLMRVSRPGLAPCADDIVPVLVFVLIKANPPAMLSTVQYIDGFHGKRLSGEEAYWWTQFRAAVEFIKVMVNYNKA